MPLSRRSSADLRRWFVGFYGPLASKSTQTTYTGPEGVPDPESDGPSYPS